MVAAFPGGYVKPEPHPSDRAEVVLFFDANMPSVKDCGYGCKSNPDRMCLHRFGPRIWICERPGKVIRSDGKEVQFGRLKDLEVALWCVHTVRRRWADRRGLVQRKRYILVTHDRKMLTDIRSQYGAGKSSNDFPLRFGDTWVQSGHGKRAVRLEVFLVQGGFHDRNYDLRLVLNHARDLRNEPALRPH